MKKLLTSVICDEAINMMLVICEKALMFVTYEETIQARTFIINTNVYIVIQIAVKTIRYG